MSTHALLAVSDEALFLGPPRSQQAGEAHHALGLFPPPPSTFQGAVRTRLLQAGGVPLHDHEKIREEVGPPERLRAGWSLDGPWVAGVVTEGGQEVTAPWVHLPRCARAEAPEAPSHAWMSPQPARPTPILRLQETVHLPKLSLDADAPPDLPDGSEETPSGWIDAATLLALLDGRAVPFAPPAHPPFLRPESRSGLKLDDSTRTAERSELYFRQTWRLSGVPGGALRAGLLAWLDIGADEIPKGALDSGILHLGRRRRPLTLELPPPLVDAWEAVREGSHLRDAADARLRGDPEKVGNPLEVWLILATPAAFPDAALGTPVRPSVRVPGPCSVEIRAAVLGRPVAIGGMDATRGAPRANLAHVPAGSAWRLRLTNGSAADRRAALLSLHHRTTLGPSDARSFGFGRTWIALPQKDSP